MHQALGASARLAVHSERKREFSAPGLACVRKSIVEARTYECRSHVQQVRLAVNSAGHADAARERIVGSRERYEPQSCHRSPASDSNRLL